MDSRPWFALQLLLANCVSSTSVENVVAYQLLAHLRIGRCVLLTKNVGNDIITTQRQRFLMKRNILSVVMTSNDLINQLYNNSVSKSPHREAIIGDLHIIAASHTISWANRAPHVARYVWIVFPTGELSALRTLKVPYNCQFIICYKENPDSDSYGLYEFYELKGENEFTNFGAWSKENGLQVTNENTFFFKKRYNLKMSELVMLRAQEVGYESAREHANVQLWLAMGEMMNFTTRMITRETKLREPFTIADVGSETQAFHSFVYSVYGDTIQLLAPIGRTRMFIHIRHQVDETSRWAAYIRPLSPYVWLVIVLTQLSASVCLIIIGYQISRWKVPFPFIEYGFTPLDSFSNQGGSVIGQRPSKRIAVACTRLLAIAIMHAYSGVIISTLTLQYSVYPFNDLSEFVQFGEYRMGAVYNTFGAGYFQFSQDPLATTIANELFEPLEALPRNILEGMRRCCNGKYAFIADEDAFYDTDATMIPCRITKIPTPAFVSYSGMMLYEFSEYRRVLFYNLLYFYSSGILKKLSERWKMTVPDRENFEEVEIDQVYSLLTLLACGAFLSMIILMTEKWMKRREARPNSGENEFTNRHYYFDQTHLL